MSKDGKVVYTMALEVTDKAGKIRYKVDPSPQPVYAPLGGGKVPGVAFCHPRCGHGARRIHRQAHCQGRERGRREDQPTGTLDFKFEVLKPELGIVMVYAATDQEGRTPTHTAGFVGQAIWVHFAATGFKRDSAKKNQPDLKFEMTTLDEKGTATLTTPITLVAKDLEEKFPTCTARMFLPLTRTGKFVVRLKVTDNVAGKSASFELPIQAMPVEK